MSTIYKAKGTRKAKVFIGVGHGGSDPGAVKYIKEADVNLNMALAEKDYLVANGVEVCMSRIKDENDDLNEEIRECNAYNPDLAHDCHNNAGGGDGFEAYYHYKGGKGKTLALNMEAEIKKIGQNSRGCKIRKNSKGTDYYGFIRLTNAPAVITEGVFVDNKADAAQADTLAEQKQFGYAYARGILKTLGITDKGLAGSTSTSSTPTAKPTGNLVKVSTSTVDIVKEPPATLQIVRKCPVGTYTITEEKNGYGKLKSGEGWIDLSKVKRV